MKEADDYYGSELIHFEKSRKTKLVLKEVLPELIGKQWNNETLSEIHAIRPSYIRVGSKSNTIFTYDPVKWSVTIVIDDNNTILSISQICKIGII